MPLINVKEYLKGFGAESRPPRTTVWRWIREGRLPAEKHGRCYYINTDKLQPSTGNALADRVLGTLKR